MHMSGAMSYAGKMIGWKTEDGDHFVFDVPKGVRLTSIERQLMLFVAQGDYKAGQRILSEGKTALPN